METPLPPRCLAGGQSEKSVLPPQLTCRGEQRGLPDPGRSLDQQQGVSTAEVATTASSILASS